jgi:hypothetical protein
MKISGIKVVLINFLAGSSRAKQDVAGSTAEPEAWAHLRHISELRHQASRLLTCTPYLFRAACLQFEQAVAGCQEVLNGLPL